MRLKILQTLSEKEMDAELLTEWLQLSPPPCPFT